MKREGEEEKCYIASIASLKRSKGYILMVIICDDEEVTLCLPRLDELAHRKDV